MESQGKQSILQPDQVFERYTIQKRLGKGGFGEVYLAKHNTLNSLVAIKVLFPNVAKQNKNFVDRFIREARLASKIRHPNLIEVYDAGQNTESGIYFIVMEYVPGGNLSKLLKKSGILPFCQTIQIITETAQALNAAHHGQMIHRDIKPDNIMFGEDGKVKLADLGIAKSTADEDTQLTVEASVFGTPAYMAPEQALDSKNVDARADIYSLGIVFFEMVTGQKPYKSGTMVEILTQVASRDDIQDSKFLNPNIPDDIAELIKDMTRKDRDKRVKSTGELLKRLARINTKNLEQQDQQSTQLTNDLTPVAASSQETALTIDQIPAGDGLETALTIDQIPSADSQDTAITIDAIQQPEPATDSEPKQQSTQKTQVPESVQPRKSKARLLIGILAAFLVFLIIVVIARSVSGGKESPKTEQVTQTEEQTEKTEQTTEATETITPTVVEKVTETAPETEKKTPDQPSPSPDQVKTDVAEQDKQEAVVEKPTKSEPEVKPPPETTQADKEEPKKTEPEEESFVSKEIPASSIVILGMNSSKHATIKQALAKKSGKSVALLEAATFSAYRKQLEDIIAKKPALVVLMHSTQCAQQKMTKSGFSNRITNEANLLQSSGIPFLFVQDFGAGNPAVLSQFNNLIREHCAVNSINMVDSRILHQDELIDEIMLNLADE